MPAHRRSVAPEWQVAADGCERRHHATRQKGEEYYNRRFRPLPPLNIGNYVRCQDSATKLWDRVGTVVGVGRRRNYHIKLPSGWVY